MPLELPAPPMMSSNRNMSQKGALPAITGRSNMRPLARIKQMATSFLEPYMRPRRLIGMASRMPPKLWAVKM